MNTMTAKQLHKWRTVPAIRCFLYYLFLITLASFSASGDSLPVVHWRFDSGYGQIVSPMPGTSVQALPIEVSGSNLAVETNGPAWKFAPISNGTPSGLEAIIPQELSAWTLVLTLRRPVPDGTNSVQYIAGAPNLFYTRLLTDLNKFEVGVYIDGAGWKEVSVSLDGVGSLDQWFTATLSYSGNNLTVSINGTVLGTNNSAGGALIPTGARLVVGACPWAPEYDHFAGSLDSIRLLQASGAPVVDWKFDTGFGEKISAMPGTSVEALPINIHGANLAAQTDGPPGSAWQFVPIASGTAGGVSAQVPQDLTAWTLVANLRRPDAESFNSIQYVAGISNLVYTRILPTPNVLQAGVFVQGQWREVSVVLDQIGALDQWFTVTLSYDGSSLVVLINGIEQGSNNSATGLVIPSGSEIVVGACPWDSLIGGFKGSLAGIRISPSATAPSPSKNVPGHWISAPVPFSLTTPDGASVQFDGSNVRIENTNQKLTVGVNHGLILSNAVSKGNGREMLSEAGSLFLIETTDGNLRSENFNIQGIHASSDANGVDVVFNLQSPDQLLTATLRMLVTGTGAMTWGLQVVNQSAGERRMQISFPIINGVKPTDAAADTYMLYPFRGGLAGPGNYTINHEYGLLCSFQLMSAFAKDGSAGVYMYPLDAAGGYKGLAIRKCDDQGVSKMMGLAPGAPATFSYRLFQAEAGTSMAVCYPWATVQAGQSSGIPSAVIGFSAGDWRVGFQSYKAWLDSWLQVNSMPVSLRDNFRFISQHPDRFFNDTTGAYAAYDRRRGPEHVFQWAFWEQYTRRDDVPFAQQMTKFQTGDYNYHTSRGGASTLNAEVSRLQQAGMGVQLYINSRMCSELSSFGAANGVGVAELAFGGRYGHEEKWWASPAETVWQDHLMSVVTRVMSDVRPSGIYLDEQPMMYPSYKTFDGWAPGKLVDPSQFVRLIKGLHDIIRGANPEGHLMTEHFTDYFTQYSDCAWDQTQFISTLITDPNVVAGYNIRYPGFDALDAYKLNFFRFLVPSFRLADWGGRSREQIARTVFNGVGSCSAHAGASDEPDYYFVTGQAMREVASALSSANAEPLIMTSNANVLCNSFFDENTKVWTLFNTTSNTASAKVTVDTSSDYHFVEIIYDNEVIPLKSGTAAGSIEVEVSAAGRDVLSVVRLKKMINATRDAAGLVTISIAESAIKNTSRLLVFKGRDRSGFLDAAPVLDISGMPLQSPQTVSALAGEKIIVKLMDGTALVDEAVLNLEWNADQTKTVEAYYYNGSQTVESAPIDLGANGGSGPYLPVPFFSMKMSGYSSGSEIGAVDAFTLDLPQLNFPVATPVFNADLYAYKVSTTGTIAASEWQSPSDTQGLTLIQSSFLTPSSTPGTFSLNESGKANLLAYLKANYASGSYITFTFRTSTEVPTGTEGLYRLGLDSTSISASLKTSVASPDVVFTSSTIPGIDVVWGETYDISGGYLRSFVTFPIAPGVFALSKISGPAWLSISGDGLMTGTPTHGDIGINTFVISVTDSQGVSSYATLIINVSGANFPPTFASDSLTGAMAIPNTAYSSTLVGTATDSDNDPLTYEKLSGPAWLNIASDGTLTGTPQAGDGGVNVWLVRVKDGFGGSDIARLTIQVLVYPTNNYGTLQGDSTTSFFNPGYINRIQLADLDKTSGNNNGYADFRNLIAALTPGQSVNYTFTPGGNSSTVRWTVWIDFNRDGDFGDSGEMIVGPTTGASSAVSGNFTVPAGASVGPSRMRIAMRRSSTGQASPTGSFSDGEVEDYSVQIGTSPIPNAAPYFLSNPIIKPDMAAGLPMSGSLAADAADWEGDPLTYAKTSGPAWLTVASNGAVSGTPPTSALGANSFGVSVADGSGGTDSTTLQINVFAAPFEIWKQSKFTAEQLAQPSVSSDLSDPEQDGIPNLIEYALGLNPNQASSSGLPVCSTSGGYLSLRFNRQKGATDISYSVEATGDLGSPWTRIWSSSGVDYGGGGNPSEQITVQDTVSIDASPGNRRFLRLKVTRP